MTATTKVGSEHPSGTGVMSETPEEVKTFDDARRHLQELEEIGNSAFPVAWILKLIGYGPVDGSHSWEPWDKAGAGMSGGTG